ncbi:MAG: hypothetical protein KAW12_27170 [Candidatus Aminicenantes bacterium]|nr:hypothetical protein [Candidatus Aminicenantes bacterium]
MKNKRKELKDEIQKNLESFSRTQKKPAADQGLQVVAISDDEFSPISEYASLVLPIPRENVLFTTSVPAFSAPVNAMATEIALKKKDELTASIKQTDKILKKFYYLN